MHSEDMHGAFCQADRRLDGGWCLNGSHQIKMGYTPEKIDMEPANVPFFKKKYIYKL